jgi:hypothetical protein
MILFFEVEFAKLPTPATIGIIIIVVAANPILPQPEQPAD